MNNLILLLSLFIIVLFIYYSKKEPFQIIENTPSPFDTINFNSKSSSSIIQFCIKEFGNPTYYDNNINGYFSWYNFFPFEELTITDKSYASYKPSRHCNNVYASFRVYLDNNIVNNLENINDALLYDKLTTNLIVRSNNIENVIFIALQVVLLQNGKRKLEEIISLINSTIVTPINNEQFQLHKTSLIEELIENQKINEVLLKTQNCIE